MNQKGIFARNEQTSEQGSEQESEPKKQESKIQKRITPESPPVVFDGHSEAASDAKRGRPKAVVSKLSSDWSLPDEWRDTALERNWASGAISKQAMKFKQYFGFGKGSDIRRSEKGWRQTWLNWLDRALKIDPNAATFGQAESPALPANYPPLPEPVRQKLQGHYAFNETFLQRWLAPCLIDLETGRITAPSSFHAEYLETRYGAALEHALGRSLSFAVGKAHPQNIHTQEGRK